MSIEQFEEVLTNRLLAECLAISSSAGSSDSLLRVYYAYGGGTISAEENACMLKNGDGARLVEDVARLGRYLREESINFTVERKAGRWIGAYIVVYPEMEDTK